MSIRPDDYLRGRSRYGWRGLHRQPHGARPARCRRGAGRARQSLHRFPQLRSRTACRSIAAIAPMRISSGRSSRSTRSTRSSTSPPASSFPNSVLDPLSYYENNTVKSRALIETAVRCGVSNFIFSSTAAVYGNPAQHAHHRGQRDLADQSVRSLEADDRVDPVGHGARFAAEVLCAALFQRCRRRPRRSIGPVVGAGNASHQGGGAGCARPAGTASMCSAPTTRPPTAPAFATMCT